MPYLVVSEQRARQTPIGCTIGDEDADPELMRMLNGNYRERSSQLDRYSPGRWVSDWPATYILNRLELLGYSVIAFAISDNEYAWTLHTSAAAGSEQQQQLSGFVPDGLLYASPVPEYEQQLGDPAEYVRRRQLAHRFGFQHQPAAAEHKPNPRLPEYNYNRSPRKESLTTLAETDVFSPLPGCASASRMRRSQHQTASPHLLSPASASNKVLSNKQVARQSMQDCCELFDETIQAQPPSNTLQLIAMPYVLVSTQVRLAVGPCAVGDSESDPQLMKQLEARPSQEMGNYHSEYVTDWCARKVLQKLETLGYKVIAMAGIGQTCAWTLHKD